jgi:hypothetical protein
MGPIQPTGILFPSTYFGNKNLKFQQAWYIKYSWIEYSESLDAMFCFYCRLYKLQVGCVKPEFTETGSHNWKNALKKLANHNQSESHLYATERFTFVQRAGQSFQNEMIDIVSYQILKTISQQAKGKPFSILCDEVSDISRHEYLSVVLRYISNGKIEESLIGLIRVQSITGESLCKVVEKRLSHYGLLLKNIVSVLRWSKQYVRRIQRIAGIIMIFDKIIGKTKRFKHF